MTKILGFLMVVGGVVLGIWLGVFVCLIGGIVQILNSLPHQALGGYINTNALGIAYGIVRILFSGAIGWLVGTCVVGLGLALMAD
jgi:hypothetical protein